MIGPPASSATRNASASAEADRCAEPDDRHRQHHEPDATSTSRQISTALG